MKHHETVVIRCDNIGARCGDVGARCGDVCICGSDFGDRAEVIRWDDIGSRCGDIVARCWDVGDREELPRYRRGVSGDIGDCGVGITPQMCNRVTNHGDMSTFSKPAGQMTLTFLLPTPGSRPLSTALKFYRIRRNCYTSQADNDFSFPLWIPFEQQSVQCTNFYSP